MSRGKTDRTMAQTRTSATETFKIPTANSSVRNSSMHPYHTIASTVFSMDSPRESEEAFLTAAMDGDYGKLDNLLSQRSQTLFSIDVKDTSAGNTALMWAVKRGHMKIVHLLLRHGADVTLRNYDGQTAAEVASPQIRQLLLDSVDKGGPHRNLLQAAWQGNAQLLKTILNETAVDIDCKNADGLTSLLLVARDVQLFEKLADKYVNDYSPVDVVADLLKYRADPNAVDEEGKTVLHYLSSSKTQQGKEMTEILLKDGSDKEARDRRCFTPIHCASQSGHVGVVVALLEGNSDPNSRGFAGATPLHISAINGHDEVATTLLQYGADVTIVDDSGLTPVDVAKTKKVKVTLKHAWTEATQKKPSANLGPVKDAPKTTRGRSAGQIMGKKKKGEVIFDSLSSTSVPIMNPSTHGRFSSNLLRDGARTRLSDDPLGRDSNDITRGCGPYGPSFKGMALTPRCSRSPSRRLTPLRGGSPSRTQKKELKFTSCTKQYDGGINRQLTPPGGNEPTLHKSRSDSRLSTSAVPLILDWDDNLKLTSVEQRSKASSPPLRKGHTRHLSDVKPSPSLSAITNAADEFYVREHMLSNQWRSKSNMGDKGPSPYPTSKHVLPAAASDSTVNVNYHNQQHPDNSKNNSPRPYEEASGTRDLNESRRLQRAKSILRDGDFHIEDTRMTNSNDSGIPEDKSSSSKRSSLSSSGSNLSSGSTCTQEKLGRRSTNTSPNEERIISEMRQPDPKSSIKRPEKVSVAKHSSSTKEVPNQKTETKSGSKKNIRGSNSSLNSKVKQIAKDNAAMKRTNQNLENTTRANQPVIGDGNEVNVFSNILTVSDPSDKTSNPPSVPVDKISVNKSLNGKEPHIAQIECSKRSTSHDNNTQNYLRNTKISSTLARNKSELGTSASECGKVITKFNKCLAKTTATAVKTHGSDTVSSLTSSQDTLRSQGTLRNTSDGNGRSKQPPPRPPPPSPPINKSPTATASGFKTPPPRPPPPQLQSSKPSSRTPFETAHTTGISLTASNSLSRNCTSRPDSFSCSTGSTTSVAAKSQYQNKISRKSSDGNISKSKSAVKEDSSNTHTSISKTSTTVLKTNGTAGANALKSEPKMLASSSKTDMIPVKSGNMPQTQPDVNGRNNSKDNQQSKRELPQKMVQPVSVSDTKGTVTDHTGPVIYDPFESIRREQERLKEEHESAMQKKTAHEARAKSAKGLPKANLTKKQIPTEQRQKSAGKKRCKVSQSSKGNILQTEDARVKRSKSPKRGVTKKKKVPTATLR